MQSQGQPDIQMFPTHKHDNIWKHLDDKWKSLCFPTHKAHLGKPESGTKLARRGQAGGGRLAVATSCRGAQEVGWFKSHKHTQKYLRMKSQLPIRHQKYSAIGLSEEGNCLGE